jgi:hypothetical protein
MYKLPVSIGEPDCVKRLLERRTWRAARGCGASAPGAAAGVDSGREAS